MASSKAAKRKAPRICDDENKKERLSGGMEKQTRFKKRKKETKELDEMSLQLEEEKRKALEILSSLCTTDAHSSADEEHQAIDKQCQERGVATSEGVACKTTPNKRVTFKVSCKTTPKEGVACKTTPKEGGVTCKTMPKKGVACKPKPKEGGVACTTTPKPESDTVQYQMGSSFSVNTDLKQLFSSTCGDEIESGGGFSFLTDAQEGNCSTEASPKKEPCEYTTSQKLSIHSTTDTLNEEETEPKDRDVPKYFFFHCDNKSLKNRIDENLFYRTEALEDLEAEWPARREAMKQSFRRRHKDALKQTRKK